MIMVEGHSTRGNSNKILTCLRNRRLRRLMHGTERNAVAAGEAREVGKGQFIYGLVGD